MTTQFYPIASKLRYFVAMIISLFIINRTCAQDVTITTDPTFWNQAVVNGNLTITGGALTNLSGLNGGAFGGAALTQVTGNLTIIDCNGPLLTSLNGLQSLVSVGGDLIIQNCNNLANLNSLENVISIGGSLIVSNNASICCFTNNTNWALQSVQNMTITGNSNLSQTFGFPNLTSINNLTLTNNNNLSFFAPLGNLTNVGNLNISNNPSLANLSLANVQTAGNILIDSNPALTNSGPFPALTSCSVIEVRENPNLITLTGFNNLVTVQNLLIISNPSLNSVSGFANVQNINYLEINNNPNLSLCCWATHLIDKAVAPTAILENAPGCESVAVVNAPPAFDICPPNATVNTDPNSCSNNYPVRLPIGSDNCDFQTATVKITLGDGSTWFDGVYGSPGNTFNYPVNPGTNTFAFVATDDNGQTANCTSVITVTDDQAPLVPPGFPDKFDVNAGTNCMGTFSLTADGFSENCAIDYYTVNISQGGTNFINEDLTIGTNRSYDLPIGTYSYQLKATDVNGLSGSVGVPINILDNTPPAWTEINLVKVVEIECGSMSIAQGLAVNMPTATDCSGVDVIIDTTIPSTTACGLEEVRHLIIARDPSFNSSPVYDLTIRIVDNMAPILSGVPSDITIGCNDVIPGVAGITATDACDGNLTSAIDFTEIPSMGSCGNGVIAQTFTYTASVTDACGNEATDNWTVTVLSNLEFDLGADIQVCDGGASTSLDVGISGQTYQWSTGATSQTISVSNSGTYQVTVTTVNGCCFVDEVEVITGNAPDISASGGTITCAESSIILSGSSNTPGVTYSWTGPAGFTSSMANPSVSTTGDYTLVVSTAAGCTSETTISVMADTDLPDVTAVGGTISCASPSIEISGSSTTPGVSYSWAGPDGFTSSVQNPEVTAIGTYTLTVSTANGCSESTTAEVLANSALPEVTLISDELTCATDTLQIEIESNVSLLETVWTGPAGFTSNEAQPTIFEAGTYQLEATAVNGCSATFEIVITENKELPELSAEGGTISCADNSTMISATSTSEGANFTWTGPDNFQSLSPSPLVSQAGTYFISASGLNGCVSTDSVIVAADTDLPEISASGGTIDCINEFVTIIGSTTSSNATISWEGPNGYTSSMGENVVEQAGIYTFTVLAESGCTSFKTVEVLFDMTDPDLVISEGSVFCLNETRQFIATTSAESPTFQWEGPGGFSSDIPTPNYSLAGTYFVTVTGTNGCFASLEYVVQNNVALDAEVVTNGTSAEAIINSGTGPYSFLWNGELGTQTQILEEGSHVLTIVDGLDCVRDYEFIITTSSVNDLEKKLKINIFPNPTADILNITFDGLETPEQVSIFDLSGRNIKNYRTDSKKLRISISDLKSGIYFLKIQHKGEFAISRFVKI